MGWPSCSPGERRLSHDGSLLRPRHAGAHEPIPTGPPPMTNYIRFFHIGIYHLRFVGIEAIVTLAVLLFFVLLPVKYLAFFPNQGFRRFAQRRWRACVVVFLLSWVGRVVLLPIEPFPSPNIHDEFSYLLASDTFAHGRLTNPTPPVWHHFEQFYVVMQPTFASKYGVAQPLFMAMGQRWLFTPRAGILLSMALAAASLCWMLQAYLPAEWALLGGLLAVVRISWFSYFGNAYWGGSVAILGGCLLLGAAARLGRRSRPGDGLLMASACFCWRIRARLKAPSSHCPFASIPSGFFFASARVFAPGCRASLCCWRGCLDRLLLSPRYRTLDSPLDSVLAAVEHLPSVSIWQAELFGSLPVSRPAQLFSR